MMKSLPVADSMENVRIGIAGLPGSGKTQVLLRVVDMIRDEELRIGGMITEPITEGHRRVGFNVVNWLTGEKKVFAHVDIESGVFVDKYGVDLDTLDSVGVAAIKKAIEDEVDLILIDEIGKMEMESENFVAAVKDALDTEIAILMTMHKKSRNPLLQDIRRRDDIRMLEVTPINRNLLPYKISRILHGEIL